MILYIMQGIPGSGKSTIAKAIADATCAHVFSTDDFWMKDGKYNFNIKLIGVAHKWNQERVKDALIWGDDVIVDNTNIKREHVKPYLELAEEFDATIQIIRVDTDVETCIKRQESRSEDRRIPEEVIRRMNQEIENLSE